MLKISKRGGFSDRYAIKPENTEIQLEKFDERTRVQLFNLLNNLYSAVYSGKAYYDAEVQEFYRGILGTVYCQIIDTRHFFDSDKFFNIIKTTILEDEYDAVLTLVEAIAQHWNNYLNNNSSVIFEGINALFKQEYVGYRFIDGYISPISDEQEVESINTALANQYTSVREHIAKANHLLSDRESPDYENSIKESISAVEAMCEILTGIHGKKATLGNMLKQLEESGVQIHSALKSAFNILYGYTNDADGIRHSGGLGGASSTFEEAKFMLVACSAFVNYLAGVSAN